MLNRYCKLQLDLNNVSLCCLPLSIAQSLSDIGSPGVASRIRVTQATATALLSCRNATCGFKIAEPTVDQEIQQHL